MKSKNLFKILKSKGFKNIELDNIIESKYVQYPLTSEPYYAIIHSNLYTKISKNLKFTTRVINSTKSVKFISIHFN